MTEERTAKVINDLISERNALRKDYNDLLRHNSALRTQVRELEPRALLAKVVAHPLGCRLCGHDHNMPPCPQSDRGVAK